MSGYYRSMLLQHTAYFLLGGFNCQSHLLIAVILRLLSHYTSTDPDRNFPLYFVSCYMSAFILEAMLAISWHCVFDGKLLCSKWISVICHHSRVLNSRQWCANLGISNPNPNPDTSNPNPAKSESTPLSSTYLDFSCCGTSDMRNSQAWNLDLDLDSHITGSRQEKASLRLHSELGLGCCMDWVCRHQNHHSFQC